jgi:hypothetical protein
VKRVGCGRERGKRERDVVAFGEGEEGEDEVSGEMDLFSVLFRALMRRQKNVCCSSN